MDRAIRIVVVDDHPIVREGLVAVLGTQPDMAVVGAAGTGAEGVEVVNATRPDIVLLDLEMPAMDGVEALKRMRSGYAEVRAIVFTAFDTDERIMQAVRAGAQGYLLKGTPRQEIFDAVRVVHSGRSLLHPVAASSLLRHIREGTKAAPVEEGASRRSVPALTSREQEVLGLLARGLQNKEMAVELEVSIRTVKYHVSSILNKLNAGNRTEALAIAMQQGLVSQPHDGGA
jgi:DNA-binding NarL/FixJ family response regulator